MTTIVHRTPGLLDTRSFTVSGMSAKPGTTTPIGQFGTGLKYAIAGLLRSGASLSIWIGREHWQFELETTTFRGAPFQQIVAWKRTWGGLRRTKVLLPFTTQLGPHWEAWMWMRELHSNTLDEGGETQACRALLKESNDLPAWDWYDETDHETYSIGPAHDTTLIVVDSLDYATAWENRAKVFHPTARGPADAAGSLLEVLPVGPGTLFYRGLRVLDLRLPSVRTWNILETTPLTEDRTMHEYYARLAVARHIATVETDEDLIREVVEADENHWEHELEFPSWVRPTPQFQRVVSSSHRASSRATAYYGGWVPPAPPDERSFWERRGHRWQLDDVQLLDERGKLVLAKPDNLVPDDWRELAGLVIAAVAPLAHDQCPTCRQTVSPPWSVELMVAADLYVGLDCHEWDSRWSDDGEYTKTDVCIHCGVVFSTEDENRDMVYEPCPGPAWMQPSIVVSVDPGGEDLTAYVAVDRDTGQIVASGILDRFDDDIPF